MVFSDVLERLVQRSAFTVMVRDVWENLLGPEKLDAWFAETADRQ